MIRRGFLWLALLTLLGCNSRGRDGASGVSSATGAGSSGGGSGSGSGAGSGSGPSSPPPNATVGRITVSAGTSVLEATRSVSIITEADDSSFGKGVTVVNGVADPVKTGDTSGGLVYSVDNQDGGFSAARYRLTSGQHVIIWRIERTGATILTIFVTVT